MAMLETSAVATNDETGEPRANELLPASTRELCYSAGGQNLVRDISLRLAPGLLTVVMGPNGAGKSILLRLLHGLLEPTSGEVLWGGRRPDQSVRQRQALVFQRPVLLRRTVAENIRFALNLRDGLSTDSCYQILDKVGLLARANQAARSLSGGEQQRLALARALALEPEVLFLDEPTAHLDPASTAAIESIVLDTKRRGTKVIFVSHDLGQAHRLADDVVFLHRGRMHEHSPASSFFQRPRSDAACAFLNGKLIF